MSISRLSSAIDLNINVGNVTCRELNATDVVLENLQIDNLAINGDANIKGELSVGTNETAYIFPKNIGSQNQVLAVGTSENLTWVSVGGGSGIQGITSSNLTVTGQGIVSINMPSQSITPGEYNNPQLTVDQQGRITTISSGSDTGITSITSPDSSLNVNVAGDSATIELNKDIIVETVEVTNSSNLTLFKLPITAPTIGSYMSIAGEGDTQLIWQANSPDGVATVTSANINEIRIGGTSTNPTIGFPTDGITYTGTIDIQNSDEAAISVTDGVHTSALGARGASFATMDNPFAEDGIPGQLLSTNGSTLTWVNPPSPVGIIQNTDGNLSITLNGNDTEINMATTVNLDTLNVSSFKIANYEFPTNSPITNQILVANSIGNLEWSSNSPDGIQTIIAGSNITTSGTANVTVGLVDNPEITGTLTMGTGSTRYVLPNTIGTVSQVLGVTVGGGNTLEWINVESPETTVNSVTSANVNHIYVDNADAQNPKIDLPIDGIQYDQSIAVTDNFIEVSNSTQSATLTAVEASAQLEVLDSATDNHTIVNSTGVSIVSGANINNNLVASFNALELSTSTGGKTSITPASVETGKLTITTTNTNEVIYTLPLTGPTEAGQYITCTSPANPQLVWTTNSPVGIQSISSSTTNITTTGTSDVILTLNPNLTSMESIDLPVPNFGGTIINNNSITINGENDLSGNQPNNTLNISNHSITNGITPENINPGEPLQTVYVSPTSISLTSNNDSTDTAYKQVSILPNQITIFDSTSDPTNQTTINSTSIIIDMVDCDTVTTNNLVVGNVTIDTDGTSVNQVMMVDPSDSNSIISDSYLSTGGYTGATFTGYLANSGTLYEMKTFGSSITRNGTTLTVLLGIDDNYQIHNTTGYNCDSIVFICSSPPEWAKFNTSKTEELYPCCEKNNLTLGTTSATDSNLVAWLSCSSFAQSHFNGSITVNNAIVLRLIPPPFVTSSESGGVVTPVSFSNNIYINLGQELGIASAGSIFYSSSYLQFTFQLV